jgi:FeS assembly protein IscX
MSLPPIEIANLADDQKDSTILTWEDSYAIAQALRAAHPGIALEEVSLGMIFHWTVALPTFEDDPELANEAILNAIYLEWFEEVNPV